MAHSSSSKRARQIADVIHHQLSLLLKKQVNDPRLSAMTITTVVMTSDLRRAKVYYTLLDVALRPAIKQALTKASGYLRSCLASTVSLRYIPELRFIYDESIERGSKITDMLNESLTEPLSTYNTKNKHEKKN